MAEETTLYGFKSSVASGEYISIDIKLAMGAPDILS